jgi:hypothetical protein
MSIIIGLKDRDTVVLGTDSRYMNAECTEVHSDSVPKIYPIADIGFLAANGYKLACDFQQTRASEIARELGTRDIETIAEALARESMPVMQQLVASLHAAISSAPGRYARMCEVVRGEALLHVATLIGHDSKGAAGYLTLSFRVVMGQIAHEKVAYFGRARQVQFSAADAVGDSSLARMLQNLGNDRRARDWAPVAAVRAILRDAKSKSAMLGGPSQIAIVDAEGARFMERLPGQDGALPECLGSLTCQFTGTATFQNGTTGPLVQITSAGIVIQHDASNYIQVTGTGIILQGSYSVPGANVGSGYSPSYLASGALASGVTVATVNLPATLPLTILAGGPLPSGVTYGGAIGVGQLTVSGTAAFSGTATFQSSGGGSVAISGSDVNITAPGGAISLIVNSSGVGVNGTVTVGSLYASTTVTCTTAYAVTRMSGSFQVVGSRQTGPGAPSITTISQAQTWCLALYNALSAAGGGHGLIN